MLRTWQLCCGQNNRFKTPRPRFAIFVSEGVWLREEMCCCNKIKLCPRHINSLRVQPDKHSDSLIHKLTRLNERSQCLCSLRSNTTVQTGYFTILLFLFFSAPNLWKVKYFHLNICIHTCPKSFKCFFPSLIILHFHYDPWSKYWVSLVIWEFSNLPGVKKN